MAFAGAATGAAGGKADDPKAANGSVEGNTDDDGAVEELLPVTGGQSEAKDPKGSELFDASDWLVAAGAAAGGTAAASPKKSSLNGLTLLEEVEAVEVVMGLVELAMLGLLVLGEMFLFPCTMTSFGGGFNFKEVLVVAPIFWKEKEWADEFSQDHEYP